MSYLLQKFTKSEFVNLGFKPLTFQITIEIPVENSGRPVHHFSVLFCATAAAAAPSGGGSPWGGSPFPESGGSGVGGGSECGASFQGF